MSVLTVVSPGLKVLFERIGKPENHQSAGGASARWDGCGHRLQSRWLGRQPMGGLRRLPQAAALHVEGGAVQFAADKMGLAARRLHSD